VKLETPETYAYVENLRGLIPPSRQFTYLVPLSRLEKETVYVVVVVLIRAKGCL
jgi:hypothetical protein